MSDSQSSRRKEYERRKQEIVNSDMALSERTEALQNLRDEYYTSPFEEMREDLDQHDDEIRYAGISVFTLGGGLLMGIFGGAEGAFLGFLAIGGLAMLLGTKPGLELAHAGYLNYEKNKVSNADNQQQQQVGHSASGAKQTCPQCGWQNPGSNNYCHDCGSGLNA